MVGIKEDRIRVIPEPLNPLIMTNLLESALQKLAELPTEQQEQIAHQILQTIQEESPLEEPDYESLPLPKSIGMGKSGRSDLSRRCEELLWNEEKS